MPDVLPASADHVPTKPPYLTVIGGGLATSFVTLAIVYLLNRYAPDVNPMGWYADYVIPIGAILVGFAAGSGYGLFAWVNGVRLSKSVLVLIAALQIGVYFGAEYIEYHQLVARATAAAAADGETFEPAGFVHYWCAKSEGFRWKPEHSGDKEGEPLGKGGYFFVGLAILGFVVGGVFAPALCMGLPYCEGCERYMKTRRIGVMPASVKPRKVKKADTEGQAAYAADQQAASDQADAAIQKFNAAAAAGDIATFRQTAADSFTATRATFKLPARVLIELIQCPSCDRGWLRHSLQTGQGKQIKRRTLTQTVIEADFAREIRERPSDAAQPKAI